MVTQDDMPKLRDISVDEMVQIGLVAAPRAIKVDEAREIFVNGCLEALGKKGMCRDRDSTNALIAEGIFAGLMALERVKAGLPPPPNAQVSAARLFADEQPRVPGVGRVSSSTTAFRCPGDS